MLRRVLESKVTTYTLFFLLLVLLVVGLNIQQSINTDKASAASGDIVMYLVPESDSNLLPERSIEYAIELGLQNFEPVDLRPEALKDFDIVNLEATTDWNVVEEKALQGHLQGIIIHHDALPSLTSNNIEALRLLFRSGVAVAGIGIPGEQLASDLLNMPGLFIWPAGEGYPTPYYYYVYSVRVDATPEVTKRVLEALEDGANIEEALSMLPSDSQAIIGHSSATDGLFAGGARSMLRVIESQMQAPSLTPVVTFEVEQ
jgi:hypothetical protein